jgi:hypothetical protein
MDGCETTGAALKPTTTVCRMHGPGNQPRPALAVHGRARTHRIEPWRRGYGHSDPPTALLSTAERYAWLGTRAAWALAGNSEAINPRVEKGATAYVARPVAPGATIAPGFYRCCVPMRATASQAASQCVPQQPQAVCASACHSSRPRTR